MKMSKLNQNGETKLDCSIFNYTNDHLPWCRLSSIQNGQKKERENKRNTCFLKPLTGVELKMAQK